MIKLFWKVSEPPTGRYRSFDVRCWPNAYYGKDGKIAAHITCDDEYRPKNVKSGEHKPLTIFVADWSIRRGLLPEQAAKVEGFRWRKLSRQCLTLDEAKEAAATCLEYHNEFQPTESEDK